ncbi:MAG: hypothetical protein LBT59_18125 [Clostridiales bacterium]|jgi:hypothetical protein|nr:hypothetical protein [Clostridiales bacterium]
MTVEWDYDYTLSTSYEILQDKDGCKMRDVRQVITKEHLYFSDIVTIIVDRADFDFFNHCNRLRVSETVIYTQEVDSSALNMGDRYYFSPTIYKPKERNASEMFAKIREAISKGREFNDYDLLLAPWYKDSRNPLDVFMEACSLVVAAGKDEKWKEESLDFLFRIYHSDLTTEKVYEARKELLGMGITLAETFWEEKRVGYAYSVASKLIARGLLDEDISDITQLSAEDVASKRSRDERWASNIHY